MRPSTQPFSGFKSVIMYSYCFSSVGALQPLITIVHFSVFWNEPPSFIICVFCLPCSFQDWQQWPWPLSPPVSPSPVLASHLHLMISQLSGLYLFLPAKPSFYAVNNDNRPWNNEKVFMSESNLATPVIVYLILSVYFFPLYWNMIIITN